MFEKERLQREVEGVVSWVKNYIEETKAKGIVIGNSGGKDSATVIAICTKAIGKEKIMTVAMPCESNQHDLEDAKLVADTFAVPMLEIDVTQNYHLMQQQILQAFSSIDKKTVLTKDTNINIRPRLRMTTLYAVAQNLGYLVGGTGNLCEAMVGYTTKWGDSAVDFNPIAQFTVEEVLQIGSYLGVPDKIIKKSPNDGLGTQTDEEKLGFTYQDLASYIRTGNAKQDVKEKILQKHRATLHKRKPIPTYSVKEPNVFLD